MKTSLKILVIPAVIAVIMPGCSSRNDDADAYGNFETNEIIVSAQVQGTLLSLDAREGSRIEMGSVIGRIDSSAAMLKKEQIRAQQSVIQAKLGNIDAQLQVQHEQRINLEREVRRLENLLKDNAATQQQYDDINGRLRVLDSQTGTIQSQKSIVRGEQSVLNAQLNEVENLLEKCRIVSPISGTVLEKYADGGELVTPGKALFKIANLEEMVLRVYVSGSQLSSIAIGDTITVHIDGPDGSIVPVKGMISWIASQTEFTPKIIQTREERVSMVYAVKVSVKNDGRLKIGMPGEVVWSDQ